MSNKCKKIIMLILIVIISLFYYREIVIIKNYNYETGLAEIHEKNHTKYTNIFGITRFSDKGFNFVQDRGDGTILVVDDNGRFGLIDMNGNYIVEPKYERVSLDISEGLRVVESVSKSWGFIDATGNIVIEPKYASAKSFKENLAPIKIGGENGEYWGYINQKDEYIIEPKYSDAYCFSEGLAFVKDGDEYYYIDHYGKKAFDYNYDIPETSGGTFIDITGFSEGLAPVLKNGKVGFIDRYGNLVIDCIYDNGNFPFGDELYKFSEGIAIVKKDGKYIAINKKGEIIIDLSMYNGVKGFSDGLALVQTSVAGDWGYIDTKGNIVIAPKYGYAQSFKNGSAVVMISNHKIKVYKNGWDMEKTSYSIIIIMSIIYILSMLAIGMIYFSMRGKDTK